MKDYFPTMPSRGRYYAAFCAVAAQDGGETREYQNTTYEYERPASTALAELAPLNNFYAGGHKVEIEQIDLKVSEPENWRILQPL